MVRPRLGVAELRELNRIGVNLNQMAPRSTWEPCPRRQGPGRRSSRWENWCCRPGALHPGVPSLGRPGQRASPLGSQPVSFVCHALFFHAPPIKHPGRGDHLN